MHDKPEKEGGEEKTYMRFFYGFLSLELKIFALIFRLHHHLTITTFLQSVMIEW